MKNSILIVEDEAAIRELLVFALAPLGYRLAEVDSAEAALDWLRAQTPDLILLDWMLPGESGVDFARRLRADARWKALPVIMLTARGDEADRVRGLDTGADDFVTKPFSPRELASRIRALLRRVQPGADEGPLEVEGLRLDPVSHRVEADGEALELGPTEFRLLLFFLRNPERVFSRGQLLDNVWGTNVYVEERTVDVHIRRLRKAIGLKGHDRLIQTVRGAGYRLSTRA